MAHLLGPNRGGIFLFGNFFELQRTSFICLKFRIFKIYLYDDVLISFLDVLIKDQVTCMVQAAVWSIMILTSIFGIEVFVRVVDLKKYTRFMRRKL